MTILPTLLLSLLITALITPTLAKDKYESLDNESDYMPLSRVKGVPLRPGAAPITRELANGDRDDFIIHLDSMVLSQVTVKTQLGLFHLSDPFASGLSLSKHTIYGADSSVYTFIGPPGDLTLKAITYDNTPAPYTISYQQKPLSIIEVGNGLSLKQFTVDSSAYVVLRKFANSSMSIQYNLDCTDTVTLNRLYPKTIWPRFSDWGYTTSFSAKKLQKYPVTFQADTTWLVFQAYRNKAICDFSVDSIVLRDSNETDSRFVAAETLALKQWSKTRYLEPTVNYKADTDYVHFNAPHRMLLRVGIQPQSTNIAGQVMAFSIQCKKSKLLGLDTINTPQDTTAKIWVDSGLVSIGFMTDNFPIYQSNHLYRFILDTLPSEAK